MLEFQSLIVYNEIIFDIFLNYFFRLSLTVI